MGHYVGKVTRLDTTNNSVTTLLYTLVAGLIRTVGTILQRFANCVSLLMIGWVLFCKDPGSRSSINRKMGGKATSCSETTNMSRPTILEGALNTISCSNGIKMMISNQTSAKIMELRPADIPDQIPKIESKEDDKEATTKIDVMVKLGSQTPNKVTLILIWSARIFDKIQANTGTRCRADMILTPATIKTGGGNITFLSVEVKEGAKKDDILEALNDDAIKFWIKINDEKILNRGDNSIRQLFRQFARCSESLVSETSGSTSLDQKTNPTQNNLAITVAEHFNIIPANIVTILYMTYSIETVSVMAQVDHDSRLTLMIMEMVTRKDKLFSNSKWKVISDVGSFKVHWPVLKNVRR